MGSRDSDDTRFRRVHVRAAVLAAWLASCARPSASVSPPYAPSISSASPSAGGEVEIDLASDAPREDALETETRIAFIQRELDAASSPALLWNRAWTATFGLITVASVVRAVAFDAPNRVVGIVNAVSSTLGVLSTLLTPSPALHGGDRLREYRAHTHDSLRVQLAHAEGILYDAASAQLFTRGWVAQLARVAVSTASALIIWLGYGYADQAALSLGAGSVVGQLSAISHPTGAIDGWRRYVRAHPEAARAYIPFAGHALSLHVVPIPNGIGVGVTF